MTSEQEREREGDRRSLRSLGEDAVVAALVRGLPPNASVEIGPGDDCAVLRPVAAGERLLFKTDVVVEGVHFRSDAPAGKVGRKALARVLSDVAAMGGQPTAVVVTLVVPADRSLGWLRGVMGGIRRLARRFDTAVVGGETSSAAPGGGAVVSVALVGRGAAGRLVLRSTASPGDVVCVTGRLGGSLAGRHFTFEPRLVEGAWLARRGSPSAMMDLSDGLAADLPRLAAASGCGFVLDREAVPRRRGCGVDEAIGDGEDYELLVAVPPGRMAGLQRAWRRRFPRLPLTPVGRLVEASAGAAAPPLRGGWDHFRRG